MRRLPAVTGLDPDLPILVRTAPGDVPGWDAVSAAFREHADAGVHVLDDPVWANATVAEVVAALRQDEEHVVVLLADEATLRDPSHPLLAATLVTREDCEDDEEYAAHVEFGAAFRVTPAAAHDVHANLAIANLGFEEFAAWASDAADGVFRGSP